MCVLFYIVYGVRIALDLILFAFGSFTNSAFRRSNFRFLFSLSQMSAARQMFMDRYMISGLATVGLRERMQLKKSWTWFKGRCVRAVYSARTFLYSPIIAGDETSGVE